MAINVCLIFSILISIVVVICVVISLIRIFQKRLFCHHQNLKGIAQQKSPTKNVESTIDPFLTVHQMKFANRWASKIVPENADNNNIAYTTPTIVPIRLQPHLKESIDISHLTPNRAFSNTINETENSSLDSRRRPSVILAAELMDTGPPPTDVFSRMEAEERKLKEIAKYSI